MILPGLSTGYSYATPLTVLSYLAIMSSALDGDDEVDLPPFLNEESGAQFLQDIQPIKNEQCYQKVLNEWNYVTNMTKETEQATLKASRTYSDFRLKYWKKLMTFPWQNFRNETIRRQFYIESLLGIDGLDPDSLKAYNAVVDRMKNYYSTTRICDYFDSKNCNLKMEPNLSDKLISSKDYEELKYIWIQFHDKVGAKVKDTFNNYVNMSNAAAVLSGFNDFGDLWRSSYESELMDLDMWAYWGQIRPLYEQIHAFTRKRLRDYYGYLNKDITGRSSIPIQLTGNMWGQTWSGIYTRFLVPYNNTAPIDVTAEMIRQNYTVLKIYQKADEFYQSLGFPPMLDTFWNNSVFQKPKNPSRDVVCRPEAWAFCNRTDFRIKFCCVVNMKDFITVHHEMGHIHYYMQYQNQPITFRDGANPGFHEAVGDAIALSVSTPNHLQKIGLLPASYNETYENSINYLMAEALKKVVTIPFVLATEQWRWDVFVGKVKPDDYNCHWWKLKTIVQGLKPPVRRSSGNFDPGAKFQIAASVPLVRYFISQILTYRFHESLCKTAGQYMPKDPKKPLYNCDIYQSKPAGTKLAAMLKLGASKSYPDVLEVLTGWRHVSAKPLIDYYAPLMKWLKKENAKTNEYVGWNDVNFGTQEFCGDN